MKHLTKLFTAVLLLLTAAPVRAADALPNAFFPFCIDWHDSKKRSFQEQADMLKELGYAGVGHIWLDKVAERLKTLDDTGLKLFQITMKVNLAPDKPAYEPQFKDVLALIKGRGVQFCLLISGMKPSDIAGDARAVEVLREMSDLARESGAQLLLYPHVNDWIERIEDSVRVAEKVNRPNVGCMFNLCHWLRADKSRDYKPLLVKAMPRLWAVSINGADERDEKPGWANYIQPLGRGSFDVCGMLRTLKELGYKGPIGLQCFGIRGDAKEHLAESMKAWREYSRRLTAGFAERQCVELLKSPDLSAWRAPLGEWCVAADVAKDPANERKFTMKDGKGVIVNGPKGRTGNLLTKLEHADVEAHIEFCVPKGSNSGVYFMARYEIQVFDSWGVEHPKYSDCGGIYQRWNNAEPDPKKRGYEGRAPRVNASKAPGEWQSLDVVFCTPRFDSKGKKTKNAMFVKVVHNGQVIHENVEVTGPTRASTFNDEKPTGPLMLQGDHGPVAYRNLRIRPLTE